VFDPNARLAECVEKLQAGAFKADRDFDVLCVQKERAVPLEVTDYILADFAVPFARHLAKPSVINITERSIFVSSETRDAYSFSGHTPLVSEEVVELAHSVAAADAIVEQKDNSGL